MTALDESEILAHRPMPPPYDPTKLGLLPGGAEGNK